MMRANVAENDLIFDVEHNARFAMQLFNAYYRTPDPSGKLYASFPEFVLIKPQVLDGKDLAVPGEEKMALGDCKEKAYARGGYVGITKYFDEKFDYHWIKLSAYPYKLGDTVDENKNEFFYVLNKFIEFTRQHPDIYGDLTSEGETDHDIALMLHEIGEAAAKLGGKLKHYPETMLVSFDPNWPELEVKKLMGTLEQNDQSWNQLLLEYLRYAIYEKAGVGLRSTLVASKIESEPQDVVSSSSDTAPSSHPIVSAEESAVTIRHGIAVDEHAATQELATFDPQASVKTDMDEQQALSSAKARADKLSQIHAEAAEKALKMEEKRIRLEALAVVTARKQLEKAEAACNAALMRIDQSQQARYAEEAKVRELEREHLASEEAARLALGRRAESAEQARLEAEQRSRMEQELVERERFQIEQERELQARVKQRLTSIGEATQAMQVRIQSEIEAAQLAHDLAHTHQEALLHLEDLSDESRRMQEEAKARESQRALLVSEASAKSAELHRAELAEQATLEMEQRKKTAQKLAELEQLRLEKERELQVHLKRRLARVGEATLAMQARIQSEIEATHWVQELTGEHRAAATSIKESSLKTAGDRTAGDAPSNHRYNPFAYEELLTTQRGSEAGAADSLAVREVEAASPSVQNQRVSREYNIAWLLRGIGVGVAVSALVGLLLFDYGAFPQVDPVATSTVSHGGLLAKPAEGAESFIKFGSLKMTDHLQKLPPK